MPYGKFLIADSIGAAFWAAIVTGLGAQFGPALAAIVGRVIRFGGIAFTVLAAALALTLVSRIRKVRKQGILTVSDETSR